LKFPAFLGNGFIINEILFSYFILLFKPVISRRDVTQVALVTNNVVVFARLTI